MSRTNTQYKARYNDVLAILASLSPGHRLQGQSDFALRLNVGRGTMRMILRSMEQAGLVSFEGHSCMLLRPPRDDDFFPDAETGSVGATIQKIFLDEVAAGKYQPGDHIKELEFARHCGASTSSVREFLQSFSRYGFVEKKPGGGWTLKGFTADFAREMGQVRELFEIAALRTFMDTNSDEDLVRKVDRLLSRHQELRPTIASRLSDFRDLDAEFHHMLVGATNNRFFEEFNEIVTFIFFYHYQWITRDESARSLLALDEHVAILDAMRRRDTREAVRLMREHLKNSRASLVRSLEMAETRNLQAAQ